MVDKDCTKCKNGRYIKDKDKNIEYFCVYGATVLHECIVACTDDYFEKGKPKRFYLHD